MPSKGPGTDIWVNTVDQMTVKDKEKALQTKSKLKMNLRFLVFQGPGRFSPEKRSKQYEVRESFFHVRSLVSLGSLQQENHFLLQLRFGQSCWEALWV